MIFYYKYNVFLNFLLGFSNEKNVLTEGKKNIGLGMCACKA